MGLSNYGYVNNSPINFIDPWGLLKFNAEFVSGLAVSAKFKVSALKGEAAIDLGSQHTPLSGSKYVSQSLKAKFALGSLQVGVGVEREASGEARPLKYDVRGIPIPGSGRSILDILKGTSFRIVPLFGNDYWENTKITIGDQFLIGGYIELDFREEIEYLINLFKARQGACP